MTKTILAGLAFLAVLAYLPTLTQPLLEDDYPNLALALHFGSSSGWPSLFRDPVFRLRTTSMVMMYALHRFFGMHAAAYYTAMIVLQVMNAWLVYALGTWNLLGYRLTAWAAAFFAVYEGHQEAIMWVSAANEPLMVMFGLLSMVCWIRFLNGRGWLWYATSLIAFAGALLSKESGIILLPLLALPLLFNRFRKIGFLIPFTILAAFAVLSVLSARTYSFRFRDGSFAWNAPFWITWPVSMGRLFWFWGLLSLIVIVAWKPLRYGRTLAIGMIWAGAALIPYSFLTYSDQIPSRQIHLASVGLAIVAGLALQTLYERNWSTRRALVLGICGLLVIENVGYLWTKKRSQFLERAAPTEQLIAIARTTRGPIYVKCFPRPPIIAEAAMELMVPNGTSRLLLWTEDEARNNPGTVTFCYSSGTR